MLVCGYERGERRERGREGGQKKRERGWRGERGSGGMLEAHTNVEKSGENGKRRGKDETKETKRKTKKFAQANSGDRAIASCAIDFQPVREERYRWPKAITLYELDTGLASASAPATIPSPLSHPSVFLVTGFFSAFALLENRAVFANRASHTHTHFKIYLLLASDICLSRYNEPINHFVIYSYIEIASTD